MSFAPHTTASPQKRNFSGNKFVNPDANSRSSAFGASNATSSATGGPSKPTYSQRKAVEKEDEDYDRMFQLFENKAEIEYLNSWDDDKLAASVYGDAKSASKKSNNGAAPKPHTSGYDFGELLKNEPISGLGESWRKY
jgi:hypothetical protein